MERVYFFAYIMCLSFSMLKGQDCYNQLYDHLNINDEYQSEDLEDLSCFIDSLFQDIGLDFKVYSGGMYSLTGYRNSRYLDEELAKINWELAQNNSSNYLIFLSYFDPVDSKTKMKVDLKMPTDEDVFCMTNISLTGILLEIQNEVNFSLNQSSNLYTAQINGINILKNRLVFINGNIVDCEEYYSYHQIARLFKANGFDSISISIIDDQPQTIIESVLAKSSNSIDSILVRPEKVLTYNTSLDFVFEDKSLNFIDYYTRRLEELPDSISARGIYTDNSIFSASSSPYLSSFLTQISGDVSTNSGVFWAHISVAGDGSSNGTLYYKINSNTYPFIQDPFNPSRVNDMKNFGPNILEPDRYESTFTLKESTANRLCESINDIYKRRYQIDYDAFDNTEIADVVIMRSNPEYGYFSSWWSDEPEFIPTDPRSIYKFTCNPEFDWDRNQYTKAIFDMFYVNKNILVEFKSGSLGIAGTTLADVKGWAGKSNTRGFAYISDDLFDVMRIDGFFWNPGGTLLHELIAHIHYLGLSERAHPLQIHYDLATSRINHAGSPDLKWTANEINRLNTLRANF